MVFIKLMKLDTMVLMLVMKCYSDCRVSMLLSQLNVEEIRNTYV